MQPDASVNVLGGPLAPCSVSPVTGFFRDGHCNTCAADQGSHTVCAIMTREFLAYSKYVGNGMNNNFLLGICCTNVRGAGRSSVPCCHRETCKRTEHRRLFCSV